MVRGARAAQSQTDRFVGLSVRVRVRVLGRVVIVAGARPHPFPCYSTRVCASVRL